MSKKTKFRRISHQNRLNGGGGVGFHNIESNPLALLIVCTISGNKSFVAHYVRRSLKKSVSKVHLNMFY